MKIERATSHFLLIISITAKMASLAVAPLYLVSQLQTARLFEWLSFLMVITLGVQSLLQSNDVLIVNAFFSLLLLFPTFLFAFFGDTILKNLNQSAVDSGLRVFFHLLLLNGLIGIVQFAVEQRDDAAIGFYGRSGLQTHGLAILYVLGALYFSYFPGKTNKLKVAANGLFFVSCTYGIGFAVLILSGIIVVLINARVKILVGSVFAVSFLAFILSVINPSGYRYTVNSARLFVASLELVSDGKTLSVTDIPRKILVYTNYWGLTKEDLSALISGVGPGNYNSRTAFLLNGDYSSIRQLPKSVSDEHRDFVLPLWNSSLVSRPHQDGSMNQPFGSWLALLAEYGLLSFILMVICFYNVVRRAVKRAATGGPRNVRTIQFIFAFFVLLGLFDNIFEYAEIVAPFILFTSWAIYGGSLKPVSTDSNALQGAQVSAV